MINPQKSYTLDEYIEILWRRIWYIIIPFVLVFAGAYVYVKITPKQYKADTLVLVSPQKVPEAFVQATVTAQVEERLQSISQEVMSRTRLEEIITQLNLYEKKRGKLTNEELIDLMRRNIKVELPSRRDEKQGYFTVSFIGDDPQVVTSVANRLASLFIEENLKIREQQAVGTTEFLAGELVLAKEKLDNMEAAVTRYKRQYMGQLPEQQDTNIRILEQLQTQHQRVSESLRAAQDRKLFIQRQMTDMEAPAAPIITDSRSAVSPAPAAAPGIGGGTYESQRDMLVRELEDLLTRFTESHPDVISVQRKIANLEKNKDSFRMDPHYRELKNQLALTDMEIKRLQEESVSLSAQINKYLIRIEQTPVREQDMASLMREYQSTRDNYETLLRKSQEAQQAENLEKRQKGEQFKVVDPARVPEKPFSPDVRKTLLMGIIAALGCGLAAAFLREQMDRSFHDSSDVEIALGLKVLAAIPKIEEQES